MKIALQHGQIILAEIEPLRYEQLKRMGIFRWNKTTRTMSFATVRLGQTSFPELASSIGKVVPLASALGVQQEELYGTFATLTGVTGSTAEVATQYKAVLSGLMSPSKSMDAALSKLGYSTADAAIQSLGFQGTLEALMGTVGGDTQAMAMWRAITKLSYGSRTD